MSVYDELFNCIEGALSTDTCDYSVYSEMFDLIADAEHEYAKLRELCGDLFDRLMDKDEHCGECRSQCEHDAWNFGDPKCVYAKRLKEVGIEVDDAPDDPPMSDAARRVFERLMDELGGDSDESR